MDTNMIVEGAGWYLVFVFSTCLHEAAHAWSAYQLGDPTAYHGGQVTLNPVPHIRREPLGMILVPLISLAANQGSWVIGWASAPYDPRWALNFPKRAALMALAGPLANLLLVGLSGLLIRVGMHFHLFGFYGLQDGFAHTVMAPDGGPAQALAMILSIFFSLNLILFVFNLLPLPPLDGSGIVPLVLPDSAAAGYLQFIRQPIFALIGIFAAWHFFPQIFAPIYFFTLRLLFIGLV